jgi:hypothetical protein
VKPPQYIAQHLYEQKRKRNCSSCSSQTSYLEQSKSPGTTAPSIENSLAYNAFWFKGQIIFRIHLDLSNAYKLMCFEKNNSGNVQVKFLECVYIFACATVRETHFSSPWLGLWKVYKQVQKGGKSHSSLGSLQKLHLHLGVGQKNAKVQRAELTCDVIK